MARSSRHPGEVRERAVALVWETQSDYGSQWEAIVSIAGKVGVSAESLRRWVRQAEVYAGQRAGTSSGDVEGLRELRRENRELRRANEILKAAATVAIQPGRMAVGSQGPSAKSWVRASRASMPHLAAVDR
jgi:transposase